MNKTMLFRSSRLSGESGGCQYHGQEPDARGEGACWAICEGGVWGRHINLNLFWVLLHMTRVLNLSNRCARIGLLFL